MASSFIIRSLARSSIESRIFSKSTKPASFFNTSSPSSSKRRPFSICRLPAKLACFSDGSNYPLHSAVAAARLASRLSIPARSCSDLSQGQKYVNKINYWQQTSSSTLHLRRALNILKPTTQDYLALRDAMTKLDVWSS